MEISRLAANYPASGIRKMFDLAADYPGFINLCNGEPDFMTPEHIRDAAKEGLDLGLTKYMPEPGYLPFRQAAAEKCAKQYGYSVLPEQIVATGGGVEGIMLSFLTILNPGDEVIIPDPSYTCYEGQVQVLGGKVVRLPLQEEHGFVPTAEQLEAAITPKTKAIVLNYPNNPTGAMITRKQADELAAVLEKHNVYIITDEVYEKIIFDGHEHVSLAEYESLQEKVIVANSLSKTYAMTGWRLGYLFSRNTALMRSLGKMHQPLTACLPGFIQYAGAKAISGSQACVEEMVAQYTRRRALMQKELESIQGMKAVAHKGSFCFYVNIAEYKISAEEMAKKLLVEAGVLTTPGSAFGTTGEHYLRFSFANAEETIAEGMQRIRKCL